MSWLALLSRSTGLPSESFSRRGKELVYHSSPPGRCPVCSSESGRYHAHGSFLWRFTTVVGRAIRKVLLQKPRYLCLSCGHTFSLHPPQGIEYKPVCNLVVVLLLWEYLAGGAGFHNCIPGEMAEVSSVRTLARYLEAAKAVALQTQQFIREVLIEKTEPRPVEDLFPGGLDPPESLMRKQRNDPARAATLWRALSMLYHGAKASKLDPSALLAWARKRSQQANQPFLI